MDQRICPECEIPLGSIQAGEVELDSCETCHGIWFDHNELQRLGSRSSGDLSEVQGLLARELKPIENRKRKCPSCSSPMSVRQKHGVELDMCQRCAGIWLDGGELEVVLKVLEQEKLRKEKVAAASQKDLGLKPGQPRPLLSDDPRLDPENTIGSVFDGRRRRYYDEGLVGVGLELLGSLFFSILDP